MAIVDNKIAPKTPDTWVDNRGLPTYPMVQWINKLIGRLRISVILTATLNPATVASQSTSEQTFTVSGLQSNDLVTVTKPTHTSGIGIGGARVSAKDTIKITFINPTAGSVDPPSEAYTILAWSR